MGELRDASLFFKGKMQVQGITSTVTPTNDNDATVAAGASGSEANAEGSSLYFFNGNYYSTSHAVDIIAVHFPIPGPSTANNQSNSSSGKGIICIASAGITNNSSSGSSSDGSNNNRYTYHQQYPSHLLSHLQEVSSLIQETSSQCMLVTQNGIVDTMSRAIPSLYQEILHFKPTNDDNVKNKCEYLIKFAEIIRGNQFCDQLHSDSANIIFTSEMLNVMKKQTLIADHDDIDSDDDIGISNKHSLAQFLQVNTKKSVFEALSAEINTSHRAQEEIESSLQYQWVTELQAKRLVVHACRVNNNTTATTTEEDLQHTTSSSYSLHAKTGMVINTQFNTFSENSLTKLVQHSYGTPDMNESLLHSYTSNTGNDDNDDKRYQGMTVVLVPIFIDDTKYGNHKDLLAGVLLLIHSHDKEANSSQFLTRRNVAVQCDALRSSGFISDYQTLFSLVIDKQKSLYTTALYDNLHLRCLQQKTIIHNKIKKWKLFRVFVNWKEVIQCKKTMEKQRIHECMLKFAGQLILCKPVSTASGGGNSGGSSFQTQFLSLLQHQVLELFPGEAVNVAYVGTGGDTAAGDDDDINNCSEYTQVFYGNAFPGNARKIINRGTLTGYFFTVAATSISTDTTLAGNRVGSIIVTRGTGMPVFGTCVFCTLSCIFILSVLQCQLYQAFYEFF